MNAQRITQQSATSNFEQELFAIFCEEETVTPAHCGSYPVFAMDLEPEWEVEEELEFSEPEWLEELELTAEDIVEEIEENWFISEFTAEEEAWFSSEPQNQWDTCDHDIRVVGTCRSQGDSAISIGFSFGC